MLVWRLLGTVRLLTESEEIDPGPGKQACVLASLLLSAGRPVSRATLTNRVWEGSPPRSAQALAPYAARLRRVLGQVKGAGVLRCGCDSYWLDCDPATVDVTCARREVERASRAGDGEQVEILRAVLRDWDVEALAGVPGGWAAGVRDATQVRPLLPGPPCVTVVTSRNTLLGLVAWPGARLLRLEPLGQDDARLLLARRLGAIRAAADPGAIDELVAAAAGLPLALVTMAARAAVSRSVAAVARELAGNPLDGAETSDDLTNPRTAFSWSYRALGANAARLFRLLGAHPGADITAVAASRLYGPSATDALAELTAASLLTEHQPRRYALHPLLREYAAALPAPGEAAPAPCGRANDLQDASGMIPRDVNRKGTPTWE